MNLLTRKFRGAYRRRVFVSPASLTSSRPFHYGTVEPLCRRSNPYGVQHWSTRKYVPLCGGLWSLSFYQEPDRMRAPELGGRA